MKVNSLSWCLFLLAPNLISAQQASDHRAYFSSIVQSNYVYIIGGSNSTLQVPILDMTNGIDINKPQWLERTGPAANDSILKPFIRGVAFEGANNQVFVKGGEGASSQMQQLMRYDPSTDQWRTTSQLAEFYRPESSEMMTVSVNSTSHIAYFYGGQPLSLGSLASADFTLFDTTINTWLKLNPTYPNATRPGRAGHSSNLINHQLFIMGGITTQLNGTDARTEADFASVLVYDIQTQTAAAIATLGDIPDPRQSFSTALGLDGRSIVMYGGYVLGTNDFKAASSDVYVLDTCTLTWSKKSVSGNAPGPLYAHNALNINNYMLLLMGKTGAETYNERLYLLDLENWKWVDQLSQTTHTIRPSSCQFQLPDLTKAVFYPYNYDNSILDNPFRPSSQDNKQKSTGLGVGLGLFGLLLVIGAAVYYRRRVRKRTRAANPRWTQGTQRDYPLFVYNKELDRPQEQTIGPHQNVFAPQGVQTYTATDHDQWEQQVRSSDHHQAIWQRMHDLHEDRPSTGQ